MQIGDDAAAPELCITARAVEDTFEQDYFRLVFFAISYGVRCWRGRHLRVSVTKRVPKSLADRPEHSHFEISAIFKATNRSLVHTRGFCKRFNAHVLGFSPTLCHLSRMIHSGNIAKLKKKFNYFIDSLYAVMHNYAMLEQLRKQQGLTQEQLAEKSGVDQTTISRLERGDIKRPRWEVVASIAQALKVKPEKLFPVDAA